MHVAMDLPYGKNFNPLTCKRQKTGSVMHTYKQTAEDQKRLSYNILLTTVIFAIKFRL